jgi:hypothetical protein
MKYRKAGAYSLAFFLTITTFGSAIAQDIHSSDFLSDYSQLRESSDARMDKTYLAKVAPGEIAKYSAVMIDQPEIFVAANSKYKGMKPDDMKQLADAFRAAMAESLSTTYMIVDQPGLKKHKKGLLGYTPVGLVAGAAKSAMTSDVTKKIDLKGLTMEMEVLDSSSEEQLAALLETPSGKKDEPVSWVELEALITVYSQRLACSLDNARRAEEDWVDCLSDM